MLWPVAKRCVCFLLVLLTWYHIHLPACRLYNSRRVRDEYGEREYGSMSNNTIIAANPDSVTPPLQIPDQEEHQESSSSLLSESLFWNTHWKVIFILAISCGQSWLVCTLLLGVDLLVVYRNLSSAVWRQTLNIQCDEVWRWDQHAQPKERFVLMVLCRVLNQLSWSRVIASQSPKYSA